MGHPDWAFWGTVITAGIVPLVIALYRIGQTRAELLLRDLRVRQDVIILELKTVNSRIVKLETFTSTQHTSDAHRFTAVEHSIDRIFERIDGPRE